MRSVIPSVNPIVYLYLLAFLFVRCQSPVKEHNASVKFSGALKNIMMKGDLSAKADLHDYAQTPHLYGLGAVEDLKGEITIINGAFYISSVVDSSVMLSQTTDANAALFVYSSVKRWKTVSVPQTVTTSEQLETFIAEQAELANIHPDTAFPFMLEGAVNEAKWHVIDWPEGDTHHTHEKHKKSGLSGILSNTVVKIIGFYSRHHHAIFTHHSTNMHMHVVNKGKTLAGHLDRIVLGKNMLLKLPVLE